MTAKEKTPKPKNQTASTLKQNVTSSVKEGAEKLEKIAKVAKTEAVDVVTQTQDKITAEAEGLNKTVQSQLASFKQELLSRLVVIKSQVNLSQKDLIELKDFIKAELNTVVEDLSKLGKALKQDVSQISLKHKDQLTDTFKRSKEHTLEAWQKVSTKQ